MYTNVQELIDDYLRDPTLSNIEKLAIKYGKSKKSIIGKLSREGVYQRQTYLTKTGESPITKRELVARIGAVAGLDNLEGLEKAPKHTLKALLEALE